MSEQARPSRSRIVATSSGATRTFSERRDLLAWLGWDDTKSDHQPRSAWLEMFHAWVQQGATGCVFAQQRSRDPAAAQWLGVVMNTPPTPPELDGLQAVLEAAADAQAVLLTFPEVLSMDDAVQVIAAFGHHDAWECELLDASEETGEFVLVGLRWVVPRSRYRSEVLGFGPLPELPVTRQAPVFSLALRTHPPTTMKDDNRVHLAQMPYSGSEVTKIDWFWERTREQRADLLNGELGHAAKARVTLRLPKASMASIVPDI